jgi:hypothetical protein
MPDMLIQVTIAASSENVHLAITEPSKIGGLHKS